MRRWASSIPNAQFLEVCVESEAVALYFHKAYKFGDNPPNNTKAVVLNGFIPSRNYMPVGYGQLGCSGFVVSDAKGNFVSRKTSSYLQYGEDAFRHVESILEDLFEEMEEERLKEGGAPVGALMERIPGTFSPKESERKKTQQKVAGEVNASNASRDSPTFVLSVEAPSSVGVESMDAEHQICTDAFNRALKDPTFETLEEIFELLKSHFAHEEALIAQYAITPEQAASPFSALASHKKDHERILSIAVNELNRAMVDNYQSKLTATSCEIVAGGRKT